MCAVELVDGPVHIVEVYTTDEMFTNEVVCHGCGQKVKRLGRVEYEKEGRVLVLRACPTHVGA